MAKHVRSVCFISGWRDPKIVEQERVKREKLAATEVAKLRSVKEKEKREKEEKKENRKRERADAWHGHRICARGVQNTNAKLDEEKVRDIRARALSGTSYRELAREFGIAASTITAVIRKRAWKHVE